MTTLERNIKTAVRKAISESFSSWCDTNVPKFDMGGFSSAMLKLFEVFNRLYDINEVINFRFMLFDENKHKDIMFEYPGVNAVMHPDKLVEQFISVIKNKLGDKPDELVNYMKNTCIGILINPDRYLFRYLQDQIDITSGEKIFVDSEKDYPCIFHQGNSGKSFLYIMTQNFINNPETYIEFLS